MMILTGKSLMNGTTIQATNNTFHSINPNHQEVNQPPIFESTAQTVDDAVFLAQKAFPVYSEFALEKRAEFLEQIAKNLESHADQIIEIAMSESGLT